MLQGLLFHFFGHILYRHCPLIAPIEVTVTMSKTFSFLLLNLFNQWFNALKIPAPHPAGAPLIATPEPYEFSINCIIRTKLRISYCDIKHTDSIYFAC